MVAPRPSGLRYATPGQSGQGLQYRPMSPWRSAGAGALQGLSGLLAAIATGNTDQAAYAFQAGLQGQQEADYRRQEQARDDELFQMRRDDLAYDRQEKEDEKAAAAEARTVFEAQVRAMNLPPEKEAFLLAQGPGGVDYDDLFQEPEGPQSAQGKLAADLAAGLIDQKTYDALLAKETYIAPPSGSNQPPFGMTPLYGRDKDGNVVVMQLGSDGNVHLSPLPEGVQVAPQIMSVDTGTGTQLLDRRGGGTEGVVQKDVAGVESQQVQGTAQGQAIVDLPGAIAKADEAHAVIDKLRNHPGRQLATGKSSIVPIIPGTDAKDFDVLLQQAKGGIFLQAYQQLKGGGAITNVEGEKGEQAIARMDRAQTEGEFLAALDDLDAVITAGTERLRQRASGGKPQPATPTPAKKPSVDDPLGILD